jgi:hypothetical protein
MKSEQELENEAMGELKSMIVKTFNGRRLCAVERGGVVVFLTYEEIQELYNAMTEKLT